VDGSALATTFFTLEELFGATDWMQTERPLSAARSCHGIPMPRSRRRSSEWHPCRNEEADD